MNRDKYADEELIIRAIYLHSNFHYYILFYKTKKSLYNEIL